MLKYSYKQNFKQDTRIHWTREYLDRAKLAYTEAGGSYSTMRLGYTVCDGTQWELEFEYNNGHKPVSFDGDNSYPYNFDNFQMLFGIDDTEEDEDE